VELLSCCLSLHDRTPELATPVLEESRWRVPAMRERAAFEGAGSSPGAARFSVAPVISLSSVRVQLSEDSLEVVLARWQKVLGLMGDIRVRRADVSEVRVIEDPIREVVRAGMKAGLRIPWLYYVCRTIRLDQAFLVRRGVPALSFSVHDGRTLQRVLVSTEAAQELATRLNAD
jgi:hypothetical protein